MWIKPCFAVSVLVCALVLGDLINGDECLDASHQWAKVEHLTIVGSMAFSAEDITKNLTNDFSVMEASRSAVTVEEYASYLCKRVVDGYRYAGFAEAKASASTNRKRQDIVIHVQEGKQFKRGEIRLTGCKLIPVEKVVNALTESSGPSGTRAQKTSTPQGKPIVRWVDQDENEVLPNEPIWPLGTPAKIDCDLRDLTQAVREAFENLGFYNVDYGIEYVPDSDRGVVYLAISVKEEGVLGQVGQVFVTGASTKSSWNDVVQYLNLKRGGPFTGLDCNRLQHRLWQSGRFSKCSVSARPGCDQPQALMIGIEIAGYEKAPMLSEAMPPAEQAMLALRRWLICPERWNRDLVLSSSEQTEIAEAVISPSQGSLIWDGKIRKDGHTEIRHAVVLTPKEIQGYVAASNKRLVANTPDDHQLAVALELRLDGQTELPFSFNFGIGIEPSKQGCKNACQLKISVDPAAAIALLYEHGAKYRIDGGILSVSTDDAKWRIETATGRLVDCVVSLRGDRLLRGTFLHFLKKRP